MSCIYSKIFHNLDKVEQKIGLQFTQDLWHPNNNKLEVVKKQSRTSAFLFLCHLEIIVSLVNFWKML